MSRRQYADSTRTLGPGRSASRRAQGARRQTRSQSARLGGRRASARARAARGRARRTRAGLHRRCTTSRSLCQDWHRATTPLVAVPPPPPLTRECAELTVAPPTLAPPVSASRGRAAAPGDTRTSFSLPSTAAVRLATTRRAPHAHGVASDIRHLAVTCRRTSSFVLRTAVARGCCHTASAARWWRRRWAGVGMCRGCEWPGAW